MRLVASEREEAMKRFLKAAFGVVVPRISLGREMGM